MKLWLAVMAPLTVSVAALTPACRSTPEAAKRRSLAKLLDAGAAIVKAGALAAPVASTTISVRPSLVAAKLLVSACTSWASAAAMSAAVSPASTTWL